MLNKNQKMILMSQIYFKKQKNMNIQKKKANMKKISKISHNTKIKKVALIKRNLNKDFLTKYIKKVK